MIFALALAALLVAAVVLIQSRGTELLAWAMAFLALAMVLPGLPK